MPFILEWTCLFLDRLNYQWRDSEKKSVRFLNRDVHDHLICVCMLHYVDIEFRNYLVYLCFMSHHYECLTFGFAICNVAVSVYFDIQNGGCLFYVKCPFLAVPPPLHTPPPPHTFEMLPQPWGNGISETLDFKISRGRTPGPPIKCAHNFSSATGNGQF